MTHHQPEIRRYSFTINNWTTEDYLKVKDLIPRCIYMSIGRERAPTTDTPHLHVYIHLRRGMKRSFLSSLVPRASDINESRHSELSNIKYTAKDYDFEQYGEPPHQGLRNDLDHTRMMAMTEGVRSIVRTGTWQQIKVAEKYMDFFEPERRDETTVYWIYGKDDKQKLDLAIHILQGTASTTNKDIFVTKPLCDADPTHYTRKEGECWKGYDGQKNVIIYNFLPSWWSFDTMVNLVNGGPCKVLVGGNRAEREFQGINIIITCIESPEVIYHNDSKYINDHLKVRSLKTKSNAKGMSIPTDDQGPNYRLFKHINGVIHLTEYADSKNRRYPTKARLSLRLLDGDTFIDSRHKIDDHIDFSRSDKLQEMLTGLAK